MGLFVFLRVFCLFLWVYRLEFHVMLTLSFSLGVSKVGQELKDTEAIRVHSLFSPPPQSFKLFLHLLQ